MSQTETLTLKINKNIIIITVIILVEKKAKKQTGKYIT